MSSSSFVNLFDLDTTSNNVITREQNPPDSIDNFIANLDNPDLHVRERSDTTNSNDTSDTTDISDTSDITDTSQIFAGTEPISSYPVIDTVLDNAMLPEPFRVKFAPKSTYGHNIYNDSKKLIEELESRLSGTKFSLDPDPNDRNNIFGERNITKFVNDQLAMRLLQTSFKYMEINGENKTLQHLLNHMKPFDGSLSQVLADKEMVIKQLRTELDLYKLKTEQTQKQMKELRQVYEERRKQEFNKFKEHIIKGRDAIKTNIKLKEKIQKYKILNRDRSIIIRHLKSINESYQNDIDYQRNRKIQARRKYNELLKSTQKQLGKLVNENEQYHTQVTYIETRLNHLSKSRFPALDKHVADLFPKEDIVGDCPYCCDAICRSDMFICSNKKCGIVSHKECVLRIPGSTCQFCQTHDPTLEILHYEHEGKHEEVSSSMMYDSDNDEDFNYDELSSLNFDVRENPTDEDNIIYRTIDEFQAAMFNPDEELQETDDEEPQETDDEEPQESDDDESDYEPSQESDDDESQESDDEESDYEPSQESDDEESQESDDDEESQESDDDEEPQEENIVDLFMDSLFNGNATFVLNSDTD
jgi:hypothetical protein